MYDKIITNRLKLWFKPSPEQIGDQKGRGCFENLVTLRLLSEYALMKKHKLYVVYIDFSKAFDLMSRKCLLDFLVIAGCSFIMTLAIKTMYTNTYLVLGSACITAIMGVKHGSPSSCFFFVFYLDFMVKMIKEACPNDGFLKNLACLLMIDDTVIFATNRNNCIKKMDALLTFCKKYGMKVNLDKSKFYVIHAETYDKEPIVIKDLTFKWCDSYTYLGHSFTCDGSTNSDISAQFNLKKCEYFKFCSFLKINKSMPFAAKLKVFNNAFIPSLIYGNECWLNGNFNKFNLRKYVANALPTLS